MGVERGQPGGGEPVEVQPLAADALSLAALPRVQRVQISGVVAVERRACRCGAGDELDAVVALHDLVVLGGLGLQLPIDAVHVFRVEQPALHIHEGPEGAPPPRIDTGIE